MMRITVIGLGGARFDIDSVDMIEVGGVRITPEMITEFGQMPEQLVSMKKCGEQVRVKVVRTMSPEETEKLWE